VEVSEDKPEGDSGSGSGGSASVTRCPTDETAPAAVAAATAVAVPAAAVAERLVSLTKAVAAEQPQQLQAVGPLAVQPTPAGVRPVRTQQPSVFTGATAAAAAAAQAAAEAVPAAAAAVPPCTSSNSSSGGGAPSAAPAAGGAGSSSSLATTVSPNSGSPVLSRESSSQGPLSSMATPTAAAAGKQRYKGRFQVYEGDEVPPPMSPPAKSGPESGVFSRCESARGGGGAPEPRASDAGDGAARGEDGAARGGSRPPQAPGAAAVPVTPATLAAAAAAAAALSAAEASVGDGAGGGPEPKKKGRFKIIEGEAPGSRPISKAPSVADLRASLAAGSASVPTGALLARLGELQEQAAAHQVALARLVEGVREGSLDLGSPTAAAPAQQAGAGAAAAAAPVSLRKISAPSTGVLPVSRSTSTRGAAAPGGGLAAAVAAAAAAAVAPGGGAAAADSAAARGAVFSGLLRELNDSTLQVAERLMERIAELERKVRGGAHCTCGISWAALLGLRRRSRGERLSARQWRAPLVAA
jgi:hypothetical protein